MGQVNYDSLYQNIEKAKGNDSLLLERYLDLGYSRYSSNVDNIDSALRIMEEALSIWEKEKPVELAAPIYNFLASLKREKQEFNQSITYYQEALKYAKKRGSLQHEAMILDNIANVYGELGNAEKAIALRLQAVDILKQLKDSLGIAIAYDNLASTYIEVNKNQKALEYCSMARIFQSENATEQQDNKAINFGNTGIAHKALGDFDSAMHYYILARKLGKNSTAFYYDNEASIARLHLDLNQFEKAINIYEVIFKRYKAESDNVRFNFHKLSASEAYLKVGNYKKSLKLFSESQAHLSKKNLQTQRQVGEIGFQLYAKLGNHKKALSYYKLQRTMQDSLTNSDRVGAFQEIESKYDVAQKEGIINKQSIRLRNISLWIGGLLALGLVFGLLQNNQRIKNERLEKENKILGLESVLIGQENERKRIARDLHDNIGTLMTGIKMKTLSIQNQLTNQKEKKLAEEINNIIQNAATEVRRISHEMTPATLDISGLEGAISDLGISLSQRDIAFENELKNLDEIKNPQHQILIYRIVQNLVQYALQEKDTRSFALYSGIDKSTVEIKCVIDGVHLNKSIWEARDNKFFQNIVNRVEYLEGSIEQLAPNASFIIKLDL